MAQSLNSKTTKTQEQSTTLASSCDLSGKEKLFVLTSNIKRKTKSMPKHAVAKVKYRLSLEGQLRQARRSFETYLHPKIFNQELKKEQNMLKWILKKAKGIVFLTVIKAGFLFAGNAGTGVVMVRQANSNEWSGAASVSVAGVSVGFLAGASKVDYIMILPNDTAVKQFTGRGQLRIGGEIQIAAGPVGREASGSIGAGDKGVSVVFSYSHAQGLYGGLTLDGTVINVRPDCNATFYNKTVTCEEILSGAVEPPLNEDYNMLVKLLENYCESDNSNTTEESSSSSEEAESCDKIYQKTESNIEIETSESD